ADLDLPPLSKDQLFDPLTLDNLKSIPFVFAGKGHLGFENSFHIFRHDDDVIDSLEVFMESIFARVNHDRITSPQLVYEIIQSDFAEIFYFKREMMDCDGAHFQKKYNLDICTNLKNKRSQDTDSTLKRYLDAITQVYASKKHYTISQPILAKNTKYTNFIIFTGTVREMLSKYTKIKEGVYHIKNPKSYHAMVNKQEIDEFVIFEELSREQQKRVDTINHVKMIEMNVHRPSINIFSTELIPVLFEDDTVTITPDSFYVYIPGKEIDHKPLLNYK
ncbi:MAG: hypothetical protein Q8K36_07105, partial [Alphaproteobacteria bacterium]|nr:hypothetical protein [Alphaproteobacteria bacterium]